MTRAGTTLADLSGLAEGFREHGFAQAPAVLTPDEVERFREASLAAIARQSKDDDPGQTRIVSTEHVWQHDEVLREFALHSHIGMLAERLAGMPLRVWRGDVLVKEPRRSARTNLHDDVSFLPFDARVSLTAWVALVDVPVERGCMTFLPGSHRRSGPEKVGVDEMGADPDGYLFTHWPELRWNRQVTVPLRAGECTFHHGRTAHMAAANSTDSPRVSFVVSFVDADAVYQPVDGVRPPMDLQPGQRLPDSTRPGGTTG
jgi:phytanoyl-CoA hydroxylase